MSGLPVKFAGGLGGIGVAGGDVAGAARQDAVGDMDAGAALEGVYHVEDRVAFAGAEVVDGQTALLFDGGEGGYMPAGEVHHMDVVAHAGAVGRVVVVAEDT